METDTLFEKCSGFFWIGRGYTAMVSVVLDEGDDLLSKWKAARDDLLSWSAKRSHKREGIEILFFTRQGRFAEIREMLGGLEGSDSELLQLFRKFPPEIALMTEDGRVHAEFVLRI